MTTLHEHRAAIDVGLEIRDRDPLRFWRFAVPRLREAFSLFTAPEPIEELHLRACNLGTKTETEAAFILACLQKRPTLDGVPIPQWKGRVEGAQFVLDYKLQLLSVQAAYIRLLGKWPHHPRYNGEILSSLTVKPMGGTESVSPDESTWSVLHFLSQENRGSGVGARADVAAFDEPPRIDILREMRKAAHAGRRGIRVIAETPTVRRQWHDLRTEYGDCPRRTIRRINQDWAECRWSLEDVSDWVLEPARKDSLRRQYERDPLRDAREHGDYCDTSGSCPFDVATLLKMLEECTEPEIVDWRISQEEQTAEGKTRTARVVKVEVWRKPEWNKSYVCTIDPSSGVDDSKHDPFEVEITEMGTGDLCARVNDRLAGKLVGVLGAGLCRQYNNAVADPEVNDRWGVNVVEGFNSAGYGNFARERRELRPGEFAEEIGFHNTGKSRPMIVGALQDWIESWRIGIKYGKCPSRAVLEQLLDCIMDESGKIVAGPGCHDESMIVRGQALRRAVSRSGVAIPALGLPAVTRQSKLVEEILGHRKSYGQPSGFGMARPSASKPRI